MAEGKQGREGKGATFGDCRESTEMGETRVKTDTFAFTRGERERESERAPPFAFIFVSLCIGGGRE